jgi:hypothetical protein
VTDATTWIKTLVEQQPSGDGKQHHPRGEGVVPILHGPLTEEERRIAAEKEARQAEREIDNEFKKRQLDVQESANRLTRLTVWLTCLLAFFTLVGTLGDHPKAAIDDRVKSGHREKA